MLDTGLSVSQPFKDAVGAFLQAFIFTILTAVFIGQALDTGHAEHAHEGDELAHV